MQDLVRAWEASRQFMLDWTLTVQYTKCWAWGTTADLRKALQFYADTGTEITGQPHFRVVHDQIDLGAAMNYTRKDVKYPQNARVVKAKFAAEKLGRLPLSIADKIRMLLTAVAPTFLYGTETVPLNEKQLQDLRQTFARALLGNKKQLCGWVVCNMYNPQIVDPEFLQAIRLMRTLLNIFHYDPIWADNIWQRAIALIPAGKAKSMRRGPAYCLAVLAWTWGLHYPADGVLGFCNRQVNLRTCDFADVRALMFHAWETRVYNAIVKRKAWQNTPPFSLDGTAKLWSKDDTRADHYIRLATCGAFPDSAVRKHFQNADSLVCPFCKTADDPRMCRPWRQAPRPCVAT